MSDMSQLVILLTLVLSASPWIIPQLKTNIRVLLAKTLKQDHICLSKTATDEPMPTGLVGIPLNVSEYPPLLVSIQNNWNQQTHQVARSFAIQTVKVPVRNPLVLWRDWVGDLPKLPNEPAEFNIISTSSAPYCVQFMFNLPTHKQLNISVAQHNPKYQAAQWYKKIGHVKIASTLDGSPWQLPKGVFLNCGDCTWAGIPSRLLGGPCTLGWLSLFTPNLLQIENW